MITETSAGGDTRRALAVRRWALWSVPGPARSFLLLVDAAAGALMITLMLSQSVSPTDLIRVGVLAFLAIGYAECARIDRSLPPIESHSMRTTKCSGSSAPRATSQPTQCGSASKT